MNKTSPVVLGLVCIGVLGAWALLRTSPGSPPMAPAPPAPAAQQPVADRAGESSSAHDQVTVRVTDPWGSPLTDAEVVARSRFVLGALLRRREWRDTRHADEHGVEVSPSSPTYIEMTVAKQNPLTLARIMVRDAAPADDVDGDGINEQLAMEVQGRNRLLHVYRDGQAFPFGEPGEAASVRVTRPGAGGSDRGRATRWVRAIVGQPRPVILDADAEWRLRPYGSRSTPLGRASNTAVPLR